MTFKEKLRKRARSSQSTKAMEKFGPYDILLKPIFTEKSYNQTTNQNKYYFKVHKDANKVDVKKSIEYIYWITPKSVNIVNVPYKGRARRSLVRRAYKKAIITLKDWDKLDMLT